MVYTYKMHTDLLSCIGNTPLLDLGNGVYAKAEFLNPSGSLKARMAKYLIERAEREGILKNGMTIVEASSGSTGNALSMVGAIKGYKVKILTANGYSSERSTITKALGADIEFIDHFFVNAAHQKALELGKQDGYFCPAQFDNEWNVDGHREWLGQEIIRDASEANIKFDAIVQGAGTGGTIIGVTQALRANHNPNLKCFLLEPAESRTVETGVAQEHKIEGISDGWVPSIIERHRAMIDGFVPVPSDIAFTTCHELAKTRGLFIGPSSGANVWAARKLINEHKDIKNVITFLCDKGEKYLSVKGFAG